MPNNTVPAAGEAMPKISLHHTIKQYQAAWQAYCQQERDDAPQEHWPFLRALQGWTTPASSTTEAVAALDFAISMYELGDTPVIPAMMKSVAAYLKRPDVLRRDHLAAVAGAMMDLEDQIHEMRHMATVAYDVLVEFLGHGEPGPNGRISLKIEVDKRDQIIFVVSNAEQRVANFYRSYHAAWEGRSNG